MSFPGTWDRSSAGREAVSCERRAFARTETVDMGMGVVEEDQANWSLHRCSRRVRGLRWFNGRRFSASEIRMAARPTRSVVVMRA